MRFLPQMCKSRVARMPVIDKFVEVFYLRPLDVLRYQLY